MRVGATGAVVVADVDVAVSVTAVDEVFTGTTTVARVLVATGNSHPLMTHTKDGAQSCVCVCVAQASKRRNSLCERIATETGTSAKSASATNPITIQTVIQPVERTVDAEEDEESLFIWHQFSISLPFRLVRLNDMRRTHGPRKCREFRWDGWVLRIDPGQRRST